MVSHVDTTENVVAQQTWCRLRSGSAGAEVEVTVAKYGVEGGSEELRSVSRLSPELPASCGPV